MKINLILNKKVLLSKNTGMVPRISEVVNVNGIRVYVKGVIYNYGKDDEIDVILSRESIGINKLIDVYKVENL